MTAPASSAPSLRPTRSTYAVIGVLLATVTAYCTHLWPEWRQNPDLSHGFFAPFIFLLLLRESRRQGPWRWVPARPWAAATLAVLLTAGLGIFALAGLFAATLAWTHALVLFLLAAALVCFLAGGLLLLAGENIRLVPVNWISATALLLWLLVAPIPTGTYARLTLGLQAWVTSSVMGVLQLLGIPAQQHGNVIELARATVGVEEACSGVRSLISCVYAGFFFAAWQVRRPLRRALLIGLAGVMALGMNLVRSLALTLLANSGVPIAGAWHDATGYAILGLTAAALAGLALLLESRESVPAPAAPGPASGSLTRGPLVLFWGGTMAALAVGAFFFAHSRTPITATSAPPRLDTLLPAQAPGWEVREPKDLYQFYGTLQTTHLLQRTYLRVDGSGQPVQVTVYIAYWPAGQTSVSRVASHTPDACWPGSGWTTETAGKDRRQTLTEPGLTLAPAEYRLFRTEQGYTQHVWFWHIFDGHVIDYRDPYSLPALLQIALQYGFQRQGSQYFVRLSSNRPWSELAAEPLLREILVNLDHVGL